MSRWITGNVPSHGTKLHFYRSGGSMPSIVLAHGITDDGLCWKPVAEILSEQFDVVMVDLRGHGRSEAPDQGYNYETMATELAALILELGLEHPAVLGHSMGAITALTMAGLFPDLPSVILLEDPPPLWDIHPLTPDEDKDRAFMVAWMTGLKRKTRSELLVEACQMNPTWSDEELEPWADAKHRFSLKIISLINSENVNLAGILELIQQITCPVLLITADRELGAILADEDVTRLRKLLPHIEVAHIPGAGHSIRREQFENYMDVVKIFLSRSKKEMRSKPVTICSKAKS